MASCCPICYRVVAKVKLPAFEENEEFRKRKVLQQRFCQLFGRYLIEDRNENGSNENKSKQNGECHLSQLAEIGMMSCEQCIQLMESFCQLFHQLKTIELQLIWKVETLKNVMKAAQMVPSRLRGFENFVGDLEVDEGRADWMIDFVTKSTKSMIEQCSRKLERSLPNLTLSRCSASDGSQAAGKSAMVRNDGFGQSLNSVPHHQIDGNLLLPFTLEVEDEAEWKSILIGTTVEAIENSNGDTQMSCDSDRSSSSSDSENYYNQEEEEDEDEELVATQNTRTGKLEEHQRTHGKNQNSSMADFESCSNNETEFKSPFQLRIHSYSHSGPGSWKYVCGFCAKKCMTKQKLEEHMRIHSQHKPFVCEVCGAKYAHGHNLRIHVNSQHGKDAPRNIDKKNNFTSNSNKAIRKRPNKVAKKI